jgi:dTDP-4-amino-4,6-dideoxygalactose transaminase
VTATNSAPIPFVDLGRQHDRLRDAIDAALGSVVDDGSFILGAEVEAFERDWATYCEAGHAVGVASGTAAIQLTLEALGVGPGDEVIVPANTFVATVMPVLHLGAKPVLVDCEPSTAGIDAKAVAPAFTDRTKIVIAVHLFGRPADMDPLLELANERGVDMIEDACQAHGARYRGRRVGALGRAGCFSFYPSKNLGALGDGGAVVTPDPDVADRARQLRNLGQRAKGEHELAGFNERLDTLQAAFLRTKLPMLDGWNDQRRGAARWYRERLGGEVDLLPEREPARDVFHVHPVRLGSRDAVAERLRQEGIGTAVHYSAAVHQHRPFREARRGSLERSEAWAREELSLPMFPGISEQEVDRVCASLRRAITDLEISSPIRGEAVR